MYLFVCLYFLICFILAFTVHIVSFSSNYILLEESQHHENRDKAPLLFNFAFHSLHYFRDDSFSNVTSHRFGILCAWLV